MTTYRSAGNWVDRDEPLEGKVARVLSYQSGRAPDDPEVVHWALTIRGMVEADASEVQVAAFLRSTEAFKELDRAGFRLLAIALWHVAKCGLLRGFAVKRLQELRSLEPPVEPLATVLERAILRAPSVTAEGLPTEDDGP